MVDELPSWRVSAHGLHARYEARRAQDSVLFDRQKMNSSEKRLDVLDGQGLVRQALPGHDGGAVVAEFNNAGAASPALATICREADTS